MQAKLNAGKLKALRMERRLTQEMLAEQTDTTDRYIRALVQGCKDNPSASLLYRMSRVLEVPMEELMTVTLDAR